MSDLISRSKIRDYIKTQINPYGKPFEGTAYELGLKIMKYIDAMDSAYDIDKVVKELEKELEAGNIAIDYGEFRLFEIVKQGGVTKNCNNCANYTEPDEVDNGCYLCCKGYEDNYEPKVDNGGVSDDVCEYKEQKNKLGSHRFITSCGKDLAQYSFMFEYNYCPYCSKKIKVVE